MRFKNKNTAAFIMCAITLSFAVSGIASSKMDTGFANDTTAWIGNEKIKNYEFENYKKVLEQLNPKITNKEVIKKIAERKSLLLYGKDYLNLKITDKQLADYITKTPMFQTNGVFDPNKYKDMLSKSKLDASAYEKISRENLLLSEIINLTKIENKSVVSQKIIANSMFTERNVEFYTIDYPLIPVKPVSKKEAKEIYEKNKSEFLTEPMYQTTTLTLNKNDAYYKKAYDKYLKSPINIFDIKQIVVKNEELKNEIMKKINNKNFNNYVKKYSIDPYSKDKNGDVGYLRSNEMTPEFAQSFKNKKIGDIIAVKSNIGYHIIEIKNEIDSNITIEQFKKIFKIDIDNDYKKEITENTVTLTKTDGFPISEVELKKLLNNKKIITGDRIVGNFNDYIQIIEVDNKIPQKELDFSNKNDYEIIINKIKKQRQLSVAVKESFEIEKGEVKNDLWITKSFKKINKKSNLDQKYIDLIYSTKTGTFNDYYNNKEFVLFKVKSDNEIKYKKDNFQGLINKIYANESGNFLLKETSLLYPLRIDKKYL